MGFVRVVEDKVGFALHRESKKFNAVIKECFNLLLPTQGDTLYNIVLKPFKNQTLYMDGRTVEIECFEQSPSVHVTIYN